MIASMLTKRSYCHGGSGYSDYTRNRVAQFSVLALSSRGAVKDGGCYGR
jgi:hypothetical protein